MDDITVYTPEQVAKILQLSKATVYQLIDKGEIPAKRIGRVYRIPKSSLEAVLSKNEIRVLTPAKSTDRAAYKRRLLQMPQIDFDPQEIVKNREQVEKQIRERSL